MTDKRSDERDPERIEQEIERTRSEMRDTLDAIERKLAPRQLVEQAMDSMRGIMNKDSGIVRLVRDNPVPLTLVAVGLGWLAISGMRRRDTGMAEEGYAGAGVETYGTYPEASGYATGQDYGGDYATEGGGTYGGLRYAGEFPYESPSGEAGGTMDKARQAMQRTGERARGMMSGLRERASQMTSGIGGGTGEWRTGARERANRLAHRGAEMYEDYPMAIGAAAVVLGAILGASLSRTRTEDQMMGRYREDMAERAKDVAAEMVRKGENIAASAVEGARREASETARQETDRTMH